MTREKKEIIKRIDYICMMLDADDELGCGFTPYNEEANAELDELYDRLARLRGFKDAYDEREFMESLPMEVQAKIYGWY